MPFAPDKATYADMRCCAWCEAPTERVCTLCDTPICREHAFTRNRYLLCPNDDTPEAVGKFEKREERACKMLGIVIPLTCLFMLFMWLYVVPQHVSKPGVVADTRCVCEPQPNLGPLTAAIPLKRLFSLKPPYLVSNKP